MKHVEASAMQTATATTGRPPSRHWATMLRRRAIQSTTARKIEAETLRHRLVVHGLVVTRRAMRPPLLQQTAAPPTPRHPRHVEAVLCLQTTTPSPPPRYRNAARLLYTTVATA